MGKLTGLTIVFTGKLEAVTRDAASAQAKALGAKVGSAVTKDTGILVAGPGAGSKLKDAKKQGVKVIDEAAWLRLAGTAKEKAATVKRSGSPKVVAKKKCEVAGTVTPKTAEPSKQELAKHLSDPSKIANYLQLDPALSEGFELAYRKIRDVGVPGMGVGSVHELSTGLYWAEYNIAKKSIAAAAARVRAIIDALPEKLVAARGRHVLVYFRPKTTAALGAEYTFYPSSAFRKSTGSDQSDVGYFLKRNELIVLAQTSRRTAKDRTEISINEGLVSIVTDQWDELDDQRAGKLERARTAAFHDFDSIKAEYLAD